MLRTDELYDCAGQILMFKGAIFVDFCWNIFIAVALPFLRNSQITLHQKHQDQILMSIPLIPGWNRETNHQIRRGRTKNMDYRSAGVGAAPVRHVESTGNATLLTGSRAAFDTNMTGGIDPYMLSSRKIGNGIGSDQHVSQQTKVLRSFGYYREAISESSEETFRDRQISILIYLSDGTCEVNESKVQNSGIPQGKLINRGPLKTESGENIGPAHLLPGTFLKVYGKMIKVCSCDKWTRNWMNKAGLTVPEDQSIPRNGASRALAELPDWNGKVLFPLKTFMEASMGKHAHDSAATKQFLEYDQDKLRFSLLWDNTDSLFGDMMDYSMSYFLGDDTVQIQQSRRANTGREQFPTLYKRDQLLKDWRNFLDVHEREVGSKYSDGEIWTWRELRVGQTLNVFGREMRVTAVDPTTRDFFRKQGIDLIPNERLAGEKVERPVLPTPAFNGYGDKFHAGKKITMRLPEWCICWCFIDQVFFLHLFSFFVNASFLGSSRYRMEIIGTKTTQKRLQQNYQS